MESLKFSISLRSLDANGRPPGTERSPGKARDSARTAFADDLAAAARSEPREAVAAEGRAAAAADSTRATAGDSTERAGPPDPDIGVTSAPTEPDAPAASATPADRLPPPAGSPQASGARAPVPGVDGQGSAPAELPAPTVPVPGTAIPIAGTAVAAVLDGAQLALPASEITSGAPPAGVPALASGTAPATAGPAGSPSSLELPAPPADASFLSAAIGDDAGAGDTTSGFALPSLAADEGSSRPSTGHGLTPAPVSEGVGDRAPEALERPPTHASDIERAERVLQQLRLKLSPGLRRATLVLEPENLGRITIALHVRDGRLEAILRAEKVETLSVLEAHLPELRAMFEQSGIDARDIDLGLGSESDAPGPDPGANQDSGSDEGGAAHDPFDYEGTDTVGGSLLAKAITDELGVDTYA